MPRLAQAKMPDEFRHVCIFKLFQSVSRLVELITKLPSKLTYFSFDCVQPIAGHSPC